jgi:uncharacterized protein (DUF58 family)
MGSVVSAKRFSLSDRISRHLSNRRQCSDHIHLDRSNIYIFPTASGLIFVALLGTMLVTAINYQNSLVYLLTFLLGTFFFLSIWISFLTLQGLEILSREAGDVIEGARCEFQLVLLHEAKDVPNLEVGSTALDVNHHYLERGQKKCVTLIEQPRARGVYLLERAYLATRFPFGLVRAWTWLRTGARVYVYPRAIEPVRAAVGASAREVGRSAFTVRENSGDLKSYAPGDSLSRIAWKQFASKDELYIRAYDTSAQISDQWVRWEEYDAAGTEQRLGMMAFDVRRLGGQHRPFGLQMPGLVIQPGRGPGHVRQCMRALAGYDQPERPTSRLAR